MIGLFKVLLISVLTCSVVWAQATAQVSGTVKDQTGAVLPGVEITATQTDTGIVRTAISDETGSYVLPNLTIGPYRLEVALQGFRTFVQTGIVLQVNSSPVINAVLEVGQVTEQVEVQANAAMVETRSTAVGQVIENERILELPLNGRNALELIVLSGAAVQTGVSGSRNMQGIPDISITGGLSSGVTYMLDGAMHNDVASSLSLPFPFPDALQEFKVETSALSAQSGMHSAGAVNAVTKSGTNEFHGNLFEFVRNDLFNARNYFARTNSTLKRNQFGGTVGGPIMKNKLFFFAGYQGTTLRQDPADRISFVPTAAMLAGDWTTFASPSCNAGRQITLKAPFVDNRIDPALYSKAAVNIARRLPSTSDPCGRIVYGLRRIVDDGQVVGRMDYQQSANSFMFGRYMATMSENPHPHTLTPDNVLTVESEGFDNLAQSFTLGNTYLIDPNTINSFRIAANRLAVHRIGAQFFDPQEVGINAYSYLPKFLLLSVSGGFALGGARDSRFKNASAQMAEDLSLVRGTHQMSFGANLAYWMMNFNATQGAAPNFSFNGQDTGLGMGDFLTGKVTRFNQTTLVLLYPRQWYFGLYGQDSWKATPRLTLNLGVRWEPYFPQQFSNGRIYNFNFDRFRQGIKSTVFTNAPAGFYYPGDTGFPGKAGIYKQWWNVAPRFGLAWDVNGDGRTSIRASYGLAFDFVRAEFGTNLVRTSPWDVQTILNAPAGGLDNPWQGVPGGNPYPAAFTSQARFAPYSPFIVLPYDAKNPRVSSFNLSIQRQVATDWLVSASYLGNVSTHLWNQRDHNPGIYFPGGPCTINGVTYSPCSTIRNIHERRRLSLEQPQDGQYIGPLYLVDTGGTANYHGLLASVQRRAVRGVTISGNYTWSHCISDRIVEGGVDTKYAVHLDDRRKDRGNCDADRRHVFNLTAVAETPQFANPTLRVVAGNWRLSGIYRKSTGAYLNFLTGVDRALSGAVNQRPDQRLDDPYGDKSLTNYFNPGAFAQPALGTLGNVGLNTGLGPGTWQLDTALSRIFRFRETERLEFRAEAYNVTNSLRKGNPDTRLNSNTFGQINSASDPRILQFALKYVF